MGQFTVVPGTLDLNAESAVHLHLLSPGWTGQLAVAQDTGSVTKSAIHRQSSFSFESARIIL
jgi:hypothetical protein